MADDVVILYFDVNKVRSALCCTVTMSHTRVHGTLILTVASLFSL